MHDGNDNVDLTLKSTDKLQAGHKILKEIRSSRNSNLKVLKFYFEN